MCIFGNSGGGQAPEAEGKPVDLSKFFVRSFKDGERFDGYRSLFAQPAPEPQAQKAANYNEDMGIVDLNDPNAMLEANTKKPKEDTASNKNADKKDRFRSQKKDNVAAPSQSGFLNFYKG